MSTLDDSGPLLRFIGVGKIIREDGKWKGQTSEIIASATAPSLKENAKAFRNVIRQTMKGAGTAERIAQGKRINIKMPAGPKLDEFDLFVLAYPPSGRHVNVLICFFVITDPQFGAGFSVTKLFKTLRDNFFAVVSMPICAQATKSNQKAQVRSETLLHNVLARFAVSAVTRAQRQTAQIKEVLTENIDIVLENVDHLEELEDRAEVLEGKSKTFYMQSKKLKDNHRWQYYKPYVMLVVLVLIVLTFVVFYYKANYFTSSDPLTNLTRSVCLFNGTLNANGQCHSFKNNENLQDFAWGLENSKNPGGVSDITLLMETENAMNLNVLVEPCTLIDPVTAIVVPRNKNGEMLVYEASNNTTSSIQQVWSTMECPRDKIGFWLYLGLAVVCSVIVLVLCKWRRTIYFKCIGQDPTDTDRRQSDLFVRLREI